MNFLWKIAIAIALVCSLIAINGTRDRISEIQQARVASCKQTYEGIGKVFLPFFPPPKQRTKEQRANLAKLNRTIRDLQAQCGKQTRTQ